MSDIMPEKFNKVQPIPVSLKDTKKILFQMENCVCKIYLKKGENDENSGIGTGFFCKIPFNNILLPVLITNSHVLNKNYIYNNKIIKLMINNKVKEIEIDNSRKKYINSDKNIDITIIEIKPNIDGINNFLEIEKDDIKKDKETIELEYNNKSIYIIHYPKEELSVSYGLIRELVDNKKIEHYCNTEKGSSGGPILSLKTLKVIGIHYGSSLNFIFNYGTFIKYAIDEFNKYNKYKNGINIIYKTYKEGEEDIFGKKFVENNKNNIELIINGKKNNLIKRYKLIKGENNIKIIIKNKITNLENMFEYCKSLKNIEELGYLDTKDINNYSYMFFGCSSLSDINGLRNWDVSNGKDFSNMFRGCSSLSDLKALQNWNVSNGKDFTAMFCGCSSLSDINGLQNWNVLNSNNFSYIFCGCSSLSDINGLQNWNVSNSNNFSYIFFECSLLSNINPLKNWNVSNGKDFSGIFCRCSSLLDIKALLNWNLSEEEYKSMI